ncbi:MAG: rhomboid family intramembrane serine protease [Pyrinomonadaceae bacterium]|nr:rhomboid family intramembrane serine protease [Pyrinomonadaceae bacterium]
MEYVTEEEIEERTEKAAQVTPITPYYSIILVVSIVVVSFVQIATDLEASVIVAGFVKPLFLAGEYWRILTSAALHAGLMHIGFNSYALFVLGRLIEILSNRAHLAVVFLCSVIGGNILSLVFGPDAPSIGASGGVIGFLGYLTVYGFKRRALLSNAFLKNMLFNVGLITFLGVFVIPNVDNFAHLGGFLVGAIYGLVQIPRDVHEDPRETDGLTNIFGYISIGIFLLTCLFSILLITGVIGLPYTEFQ